ncbi:SGNH/GDSL hydrolase family protein [Arundinibacter roseus]|uniref:SGNH/GDSL hydrolase family protein n=1 Tax=Arundinibacter roseus TaxID=2070510 RepID=A0A4R4KLQ0_9BACT|nr:SGNH/GDSL hydrolase family protein [Arundinibacter roseus]TDB68883.1 SGNH/GDSL hydrolase family protein [Arundinibacter roseus]
MNFNTSIVILSLCFLACVAEPTPAPPPVPELNDSTGVARFLSLGDSYTIGESVPENDRWSVQLAALLRKDGINVAPPEIIARTGWTTAELASAIEQANKPRHYQLVSLLIGVNNQYRGQSTERFRTEFKELLTTSIAFAQGRKQRVFVLSIPDWGVSPFGANSDRAKIARDIDAFNAVAKEECEAAGVLFIDITPLSRSGLNQADMFASDGLHFSGKMYGLWAREALPAVKALLSK